MLPVPPRTKRQLVLLNPNDPSDPSAGYAPLGSPEDVEDALAPYNTARDGSGGTSSGTIFFHGPGIVVEIPRGHDTIQQALITVIEADIAFPVLMKLCRGNAWKLQDVESGQMFG